MATVNTANHSHFCSKCDEVCPEIVCVWFLTAFVSKDKWGKDEAPIVDWDEVKQAWTLHRCKWWHLRELDGTSAY